MNTVLLLELVKIPTAYEAFAATIISFQTSLLFSEQAYSTH